jgi:hypothetical protein
VNNKLEIKSTLIGFLLCLSLFLFLGASDTSNTHNEMQYQLVYGELRGGKFFVIDTYTGVVKQIAGSNNYVNTNKAFANYSD